MNWGTSIQAEALADIVVNTTTMCTSNATNATNSIKSNRYDKCR